MIGYAILLPVERRCSGVFCLDSLKLCLFLAASPRKSSINLIIQSIRLIVYVCLAIYDGLYTRYI